MSFKIVLQTSLTIGSAIMLNAQQPNQHQTIINAINQEVNNNSQLELLATELLDDIGPRLVGSPEMLKASDWAIAKFNDWGIKGERQDWGEWKAWQRGTSTVTMTSPRVLSLDATQLAWSPTTKKAVEGEVVVLPENSADFANWSTTIKGKIVLISPYQSVGRPDYQLKEFATPETYDKLKKESEEIKKNHQEYLDKIGYNQAQLAEFLEQKGAIAIAISNWTGIMGANRIFDAKTKNIPMIDIEFEDYGLLYRLAKHNKHPKIKVDVQSQHLGKTKTFNTIGIIEGKEKQN